MAAQAVCLQRRCRLLPVIHRVPLPVGLEPARSAAAYVQRPRPVPLGRRAGRRALLRHAASGRGRDPALGCADLSQHAHRRTSHAERCAARRCRTPGGRISRARSRSPASRRRAVRARIGRCQRAAQSGAASGRSLECPARWLGAAAARRRWAAISRSRSPIVARIRSVPRCATADGTVLCSAAPVTFSVQRPSVNSPQSRRSSRTPVRRLSAIAERRDGD